MNVMITIGNCVDFFGMNLDSFRFSSLSKIGILCTSNAYVFYGQFDTFRIQILRLYFSLSFG